MSDSARCAILAGAAALTLASAPPVLAADHSPTVSRGAAATTRPSEISQYFAGYLDPVGAQETVVATIILPTLDCTSEDEGIGTYAEFANEGGFRFAGAAVYSYCYGGTGVHLAAVQSYDDGVFYLEGPVADGDEVTLSAKAVDGGVKATVQNRTQGWTEDRVLSDAVQPLATIVQNVIGLDGAIVPPLSEDTSVRRARIGGEALALVDPDKLVLVDLGVDPEIKPSRIRRDTNFTFKNVA